MNKHKQGVIKGLAIGLIIGLMVQSVPAIAATVTKMIEVTTGVNLYVDDIPLLPKDANGNSVDTFIYNGTTYLPVRAISEAVGLWRPTSVSDR